MRKNFEMFSEQFNDKLNSNNLQKQKSLFAPKTKKFLNNLKYKINITRNKSKILLVVALLVVFAGSVFMARNIMGRLAADNRMAPPEAIASQQLNKKFTFPIKDQDNEEVSRITYLVESASLQDEFIYQGKLASAVKGRTFLIFDLKIENPYTQTIEVNTKDYIRVKLNGKDELLAPEIHNDPVSIQAKSTKLTRVGLPINDTDKDIVVLIGEIEGEKQEVKLNIAR